MIVGIDASHEVLTAAVSRHRTRNVYPHFRKRGFEVTRFRGQRATRNLVAPAVSDPAVNYVTGVGHGELDRYKGDQDIPLFQVGSYAPAEVSAKIVHFLSCLTALQLGPDFVANGTRAYFGYGDNFAIDTRIPAELHIELQCDAEIDRGFADGLSAAAVYRRVYEYYTVRIAEATRSKKHALAGRLMNNRDALCAPSVHARWGGEEASL
jgi:hypothetical protein